MISFEPAGLACETVSDRAVILADQIGIAIEYLLKKLIPSSTLCLRVECDVCVQRDPVVWSTMTQPVSPEVNKSVGHTQ
jgi:hypothetical protein